MSHRDTSIATDLDILVGRLAEYKWITERETLPGSRELFMFNPRLDIFSAPSVMNLLSCASLSDGVQIDIRIIAQTCTTHRVKNYTNTQPAYNIIRNSYLGEKGFRLADHAYNGYLRPSRLEVNWGLFDVDPEGRLIYEIRQSTGERYFWKGSYDFVEEGENTLHNVVEKWPGFGEFLAHVGPNQPRVIWVRVKPGHQIPEELAPYYRAWPNEDSTEEAEVLNRNKAWKRFRIWESYNEANDNIDPALRNAIVPQTLNLPEDVSQSQGVEEKLDVQDLPTDITGRLPNSYADSQAGRSEERRQQGQVIILQSHIITLQQQLETAHRIIADRDAAIQYLNAEQEAQAYALERLRLTLEEKQHQDRMRAHISNAALGTAEAAPQEGNKSVTKTSVESGET